MYEIFVENPSLIENVYNHQHKIPFKNFFRKKFFRSINSFRFSSISIQLLKARNKFLSKHYDELKIFFRYISFIYKFRLWQAQVKNEK